MFIYLDCFAGISGDMFLGAMVDLGMPADYLTSELEKLGLSSKYCIDIIKTTKNGISGTKVNVELREKEHTHRHLKDICDILEASSLAENVKSRGLKIFSTLAEAEAEVHGVTIEEIHFHEVGAIDAIVDIMGASLAIEYFKENFGVNKLVASSVEVGGGFVKCAHGFIPVPAPAVAELLKGIPINKGLANSETTTPTGAAILKSNVESFTNKLQMCAVETGYGFGTKDFPFLNALRVCLCKETEEKNQEQYIIETNIDDMNSEILGYVEEKLFQAGALDVFKTPIYMKKGRPAVKLSVLITPDLEKKVVDIIFRETTSFGLRKLCLEKETLERRTEKISTVYGEITVKFAVINGEIIKYKAEYEDCKRVAEERKIPLYKVYSEVADILKDK